jgi:hypothetical protein
VIIPLGKLALSRSRGSLSEFYGADSHLEFHLELVELYQIQGFKRNGFYIIVRSDLSGSCTPGTAGH